MYAGSQGADRRLLTTARRGALFGALVAFVVVASACGAPAGEGNDLLEEDTVTVRPRVAIDGLIELSARTEGRLFVDEVVFHAPSVQIRNGPFAIADLLSSDPDDAGPLFFRYALADGGGAGAVASERRWSLTPEGVSPQSEVSFGFAPFTPSDAELDEVLARTGWDLSALDGYTAYIHGYVSVGSGDVSIRSASRFAGEGERMAGDSEGDPAHGDTAHSDTASGDAEGDPARQASGGDVNAGDSEGDTAHGGDDIEGDSEGDPAHGGENLAGDSEGDPAEVTGDKQASSGGDGSDVRRPGSNASGGELVPFFLVFDSSLELGVPLMELGLGDLASDEFLPIDLRVDVNRLLHDDRLADLDAEAADVLKGAEAGFAVLEVGAPEARRAFEIDLDAIQKRTPSKDPDKHTIQLSSDPRR